MILTSTDKAANPTSVMGASKLLAEKLVTAATNYRGTHQTPFASVRFGNVLGSRGSALELFARQIRAGGPVTVTDPSMTRFVMTTPRAVELALKARRCARWRGVRVQDARREPGRPRRVDDRHRRADGRPRPGSIATRPWAAGR